MNQLILLGNVGQNAEVHKFENNRFSITFNIAVTESWKDSQGIKQSKTEWFRCVRYATSDALAQYIKKGMKLLIIGKASSEAYIKENEAIPISVCIVREIQFLDSANSQQSNSNTNDSKSVSKDTNTDDDGLPF